MQKAIVTGVKQAQLANVAQPKAVANWAVVKVHAAPMCTEYKSWRAGGPAAFLGHEAAGEVVEIAQPGPVRVGDRVVVMPQYPCGKCALCQAGDYIHCEHLVDVEQFTGSPEGKSTYTQYLIKPDWLLPKIPDGVSYEHASLACCGLGPSFGAYERVNLTAQQTALVTGLGPVGLGAIVNAVYRGARVIAVESHPWRAERARMLGAEAVIDPRDPDAADQIRALTKDGVGVDAAVDCSGTVPAQRLCIDAARRKGAVVFIGECGDELPIRVSPDMIRKGLTLAGSWHYNLRYFDGVMKVIQTSPLLDSLISHTFPMSAVQQAFELQDTGNCAKVILKPWA